MLTSPTAKGHQQHICRGTNLPGLPVTTRRTARGAAQGLSSRRVASWSVPRSRALFQVGCGQGVKLSLCSDNLLVVFVEKVTFSSLITHRRGTLLLPSYRRGQRKRRELQERVQTAALLRGPECPSGPLELPKLCAYHHARSH